MLVNWGSNFDSHSTWVWWPIVAGLAALLAVSWPKRTAPELQRQSCPETANAHSLVGQALSQHLSSFARRYLIVAFVRSSKPSQIRQVNPLPRTPTHLVDSHPRPSCSLSCPVALGDGCLHIADKVLDKTASPVVDFALLQR